ncbi:MAG: non-contractile tail sheath protein, partial [Culicoidibacterales bacterium]
PPTNFYSPTMPEVKTYIRKVSKEMLDIMVDNKFKPILQLGEPWWWFQEFQHGNVNLPYEGKPPCFYDKYTKKQFKEDTGKELKVYDRSDYFYINEIDDFYTSKLRQYLGEYSDFMKSISAEYENSEYAVLFFPPSVIDKGRTPLVMQKVNAPFEFWDDNKLDFIQIEDYDWIVHDHPEHLECYMFAWDQLGYPFHKQHYFTGFAWEEFGIPIETQWERIEKAGAGAISRGFRETFVWAGSQIRRDSWVPKANYYSSDGERWLSVNFHPHI